MEYRTGDRFYGEVTSEVVGGFESPPEGYKTPALPIKLHHPINSPGIQDGTNIPNVAVVNHNQLQAVQADLVDGSRGRLPTQIDAPAILNLPAQALVGGPVNVNAIPLGDSPPSVNVVVPDLRA